jgi:hypothetical protein
MLEGHIWKPYLDLCTGTRELDVVRASLVQDPVVVGAVGGSGTRLVRNILLSLGVEMMSGVNSAGDAYAWPPLERILSSHGARYSSREALCSHAFAVFESFLQEHVDRAGRGGTVGWKNPGSFLWLPELSQYFPQLRYVHVIRHGLDMAYARNIRQFRTKHWYFGIQTHDMGEDPRQVVGRDRVLDYWIESNRFAFRQFRTLPLQHHLLVYENLCERPQEEIRQLADFLGLPECGLRLQEAASQVTPNPSIGRFREHDWQGDFRSEQLDVVRELGFAV